MSLTPFIARERVVRTLMNWHPRYRRGEGSVAELAGHVVLLGYGRSGPRILDALDRDQVPVVVIDEDAVVIRKLAARGIHCIQGDAADLKTLQKANASRARAVLVLLRQGRDARFVMQHLCGQDTRVFVRTMEPDEAVSVEACGGIPIRAEKEAAAQFVEWLRLNP
jgi:CPA2 family monovalent cation:H+ antiporter-2